MAKQKNARVLVDCVISGADVQCGSVVNADETEINILNKQGQVDSSKEAVEFALKDGAKLIEIAVIQDVDEVEVEVEVDSHIDQIVQAINSMDQENDKLWTEEDKPKVEILEDLMDKKITAAQRDEAFSIFIQQ